MPSATTAAVAVARPLAAALAAALTVLSGLAFAGTGVAVLVARRALFSAGVASMLLVYGALVAALGLMLWRLRSLAFGGTVACSLLHLLVLVNLARGSHTALFWILCVVPLSTLVCLFTPASRQALGRT